MRHPDVTAWLRRESRAIQAAADRRELDNAVAVCYWLVGQGKLPEGIYRHSWQHGNGMKDGEVAQGMLYSVHGCAQSRVGEPRAGDVFFVRDSGRIRYVCLVGSDGVRRVEVPHWDYGLDRKPDLFCPMC